MIKVKFPYRITELTIGIDRDILAYGEMPVTSGKLDICLDPPRYIERRGVLVPNGSIHAINEVINQESAHAKADRESRTERQQACTAQ